MNLGEAIMFMLENPGVKLCDSDGDIWWFEQDDKWWLQNKTDEPVEANITLEFMLGHVFTICKVQQ